MTRSINQSYVHATARDYAIRQLFGRAGAIGGVFEHPTVQGSSEGTTVTFAGLPGKCLRFKSASAGLRQELARGWFRNCRAGWTHSPDPVLGAVVPDFVVPFAEEQTSEIKPLFRAPDGNTIECDFDLPLSVLLTLSRFEETLPGERDQHGRFPSSQSFAARGGFLGRPIVDEYGLALEQALRLILPGWQPAPRRLRVKITHDVDDVGVPFHPRQTLGHLVRRFRPAATFRDLFAAVTPWNPAYLDAVWRVAKPAIDCGLTPAVYWKASPRGPMDSGYDPSHPKIRRMMERLREHGVENGVHPGFDTYLRPGQLRKEVDVLRGLFKNQRVGGRQHYLRWCPETWQDWESCGLAYDSSVGFADCIGFRAGTCYPYRPWLLSKPREMDLVELPLIVMDVTLVAYMGLSREESLRVVEGLLERCRAVGGVFTLLWHSGSLLDRRYDGLYEAILAKLEDAEDFDWEAEPAERRITATGAKS